MKTAILIHGCHLGAKGWEDIIWGKPQEGVLGRASKGLSLAAELRPEFIYWGTGASEKDGMKEAECIFSYARSRIHELPYFEGRTHAEIDEALDRLSVFDVLSQSTPQEVLGAMYECRDRDINQLYLVSSPTHIARCLQSAEIIRAKGGFDGLEIFATASDTCFADSTPNDVLIVEPPHRADRPEVPIHKTLRRAMRLGRGELAEQFNTSLDAFLRGWEKDS